MLCRCTFFAAAVVMLPTPALAFTVEIRDGWFIVYWGYGQYTMYPIVIVLLAVLFALVVLGALVSSSSTTSYSEPDHNTAEQYEAEAARLRSLRHQTDEHTALMESLIRHARTEGEYSELSQIADHEKKVRGIRRLFQ